MTKTEIRNLKAITSRWSYLHLKTNQPTNQPTNQQTYICPV